MNDDALAQRLHRLEAAEAIRNLKARYLAACDRKDPATMRACFADGTVEIDYGAVGCFDNADALVALYTQMACHDHMVELHHGSNPQISVTAEEQTELFLSLVTQRLDDQAATLALELDASQLKVLFAGRTPPAME